MMNRKTCLLPGRFSVFLMIVAFFTNSAFATDIDLTPGNNSWTTLVVGSSDLVSVGQNLTSSYSSSDGVLRINISNTAGAGYQVYAKLNSSLPNGMGISVLRVSDGTGGGSITGGDTPLALTTVDAAFFSGVNDRTDIQLRITITGVSLDAPPAVYTRYITFTVS